MSGEINRLIDSIRHTGINLSIYLADDVSAEKDDVICGLNNDKEIFCDSKTQKTYFYTEYAGEKLILSLPGAAKEHFNYAVIIKTLIKDMGFSVPQNFSQQEKLRLLILGALSETQKSILKNDLGKIKIDHFFIAFTLKQRKKTDELKDFLNNISSDGDILVVVDEHTLVFLKSAEEPSYSSAYDFAKIIYENIREELSLELTVCDGGSVKSPDELSSAYEKCVFTLKYGKVLSKGSAVLSYKNFALVKILSQLPRAELSRYLDQLSDKNIETVLADAELTLTAEKFMENSLNISETSRNMYIHRNTLIYRLDKIESETGLNLRNFGDADVFRLIEIIKTLVAKG